MAKTSLPTVSISSNDKALIGFSVIVGVIGLSLLMPQSTIWHVIGAIFLLPAGGALLYYLFTPYISAISLYDDNVLVLQKTVVCFFPLKKIKINLQELTTLHVFDKDKQNKTIGSLIENPENFFLSIKKIGVLIKSKTGFSEKIDNFDDRDLKNLLVEINNLLAQIPPITSCRTCHDKGKLSAPTRYIQVNFDNETCYVCRNEKQPVGALAEARQILKDTENEIWADKKHIELIEKEIEKLATKLTNPTLGEEVRKLIEQNIEDFKAQISLKNTQLQFHYQTEKQLHQLLYDDYMATQLVSQRELLDKFNDINTEDFKKIEVKRGVLETNRELLHKIQSTLIYLEDKKNHDVSIADELAKEIRQSLDDNAK